MSMVQLMRQGNKEIDEIDHALGRAERIAQDTLEIGTQVTGYTRQQMLHTKYLLCTVACMPLFYTLRRARNVSVCPYHSQAAQGLNDQTDKLNKIVDDLNEIEFTMKKATKVISDITRGLLTDK
jgi:SNARE protein